MLANVSRTAAVTFLLVFAVLGLAFFLGETAAEPGDIPAPIVAALVLVPTLGLSLAVLWRLSWAEPALTFAAVAVALFALADGLFDLVPRDTGPVHAATALTLVAPLALLGRRDPRTAGQLLVLVGLAPVVALTARSLTGGAGAGGSLGGSSGAVALPMVLGGLVLLLSAQGSGGRRTSVRRPHTG
ncbi:hypothetical protein [Nocardioides mesophilus]|uniref:Uncharacterized protein n=1 Tax=Nocardioides mesophilus TaxID=433659 RepID=A0A7G9R760_9ACTN|nr:hypothetical protein [Nocardioides mesophilus]QNN51435.1 hypothetical protein H9L09_12530 [Nocardioides mesophilus]